MVVAGIVSGGAAVARVVVTLNGAEVARLEEKAPQPAMALNVPLKLVEGENTVVVTAADADGRLSQELRLVQFDKLTPLTVALRYPEDRVRVTEPDTVVAALVTSSKGVTSARVMLNGAEVWSQIEKGLQKSVAIAAPVTLRPGLTPSC